MSEVHGRSAEKRALIYAQHVSEDSQCSGCCSTASVRVAPGHPSEDEDIRRFGSCCGIKRRIVCNNWYFPPRRSHNNHHSYANILLPITVILDIVSVLGIIALFSNHTLLHMNLRMLFISTIGVAILVSTTIVMNGLCVISWWKSCSCHHDGFIGDFEESESIHYTGFGAASDIESGKHTLAFFSAISPFENPDDDTEQNYVIIPESTINIDNDGDDDQSVVRPTTRTTEVSFVQGINIATNDLSRTSEYIENQRRLFYSRVDKLAIAKNALEASNKAPFLSICCFPSNGQI